MSSNTFPRQARFETWRLGSVYIVFALVFFALLLRLVNLQIFEGSDWTSSAVDNYTNEVSIPAARGIIYDRNGYVLARNIAGKTITLPSRKK